MSEKRVMTTRAMKRPPKEKKKITCGFVCNMEFCSKKEKSYHFLLEHKKKTGNIGQFDDRHDTITGLYKMPPCIRNLQNISTEDKIALLGEAHNYYINVNQEMVEYRKKIEDLTNELGIALAKIQILEEKNYENSDKVKETESKKNLQEMIYNDKNSNNEHSDTSLDPSNCHENLIDPEHALMLLHAASNKPESSQQKKISDLSSNVSVKPNTSVHESHRGLKF